METFSYKTIELPAEGIYKEKGSRFLAFAYPVKNEDEIKHRIQELKKKYYDARHHCFAWILGADKKFFRAFDDGEPNHSAGDPILGQIRSNELTDILIVVVRYFGGTKLGVGGLVAAYRSAAESALLAAKIVEREVMFSVMLEYGYDSTPRVMRIIKEFGLRITHQSHDVKSIVQLEGALRLRDKILEKLQNIT